MMKELTESIFIQSPEILFWSMLKAKSYLSSSDLRFQNTEYIPKEFFA